MVEKKTNAVKCCDCKYSAATSETEKSWYCDNPVYAGMIEKKWREKGAKTSLAKAKTHGSNFSCGYGRYWNDNDVSETDTKGDAENE
jgi:hypothetical protein